MFENHKNLTATFTTIDDENLAYHVTDNIDQVDTARVNLSKKLNFDMTNLQYMNQIHSNIVQTSSYKTNLKDCDALITNKLNTPLMVMVADCIPVLFYDSVKNVIAVAHAGRNGTYQNIVKNTIDKMCGDYHCLVSNIEVVLGPSIQKCCYEVSVELANEAKEKFGDKFVVNRNLDLQAINKMQLLNCGILEENIEVSKTCTKCSNKPYFSYRNDKACGRFAGVIMMKRS